ncbi:hypothetical protein JHK86_016340 [Glycine max]|nr:hypothetical protein JHK86_016340 [Glycine max]
MVRKECRRAKQRLYHHEMQRATSNVHNDDDDNLKGFFLELHPARPHIGLALMEAKFFRFLKIVGVGYKARAEAAGRLLYLKLGYSHEVELTVPPAVRVFCFKNNVICCTGIDKQRVHQFAATVRTCKPPEVYKGKGIMYVDEVIKKKQGKKSK